MGANQDLQVVQLGVTKEFASAFSLQVACIVRTQCLACHHDSTTAYSFIAPQRP